MNTFLKKISCGSNFIVGFPSAVKLEFGISSDAYISFLVSKRDSGHEVVFEKGKVAGNPYEDWSLEITPSELDCGLGTQIFADNTIYNYHLAVYSESSVGKNTFYIQCYLLTKNLFAFENVAYQAVVLNYSPGYYKEDSTDSGNQEIRISFQGYANDVVVDSKYLNPNNTSIFGFDYVLGQHGSHDNLVFKSGTYELSYDENTGLWYVPKERLLNGDWHYDAQIEPISWKFSTKFGWIDGDFLNAETGVAMHSYRRGFSYADEPSASGWTFGSLQTDNMDYEHGLTAHTGDGLTGGPTQKLSVIQNAIKTTSDPDWAIFKSRYYNRYDIRGFQLNGVERIIDGSTYSLATVDSPIISMDEDLNGFIQGVGLDTLGNSDLKASICKDDILHWTAVLDAQSRSVNVDWTIPSGYTAHWAAEQYGSHIFSPSDFKSFDFDLDVPVGVGESDYFQYHSSWPIDDEALTPISKGWALPKMYLESAGTYWVLAGFTRGGSTRFIQEGDVPGNITEIAAEQNHYLWNVGDVFGANGFETSGENVLLNNLDGNGTIYPIWGRARAITLTYSFDEASDESSSSYVPPVESSSSTESSSESSFESSSSWNDDWASEGYLLDKLQSFVDYMGQIGKTAVSHNLVSTSQIVSALDTMMENVGGLNTVPSGSSSSVESYVTVTTEQVLNSFDEIELRFHNVADMAYAYGNMQFTKVSQFSAAIYGLNNALVAVHSETPEIVGGRGELAFKTYVDEVFNAVIAKYVTIAENVLAIKSDFDSEPSVGMTYLGETLVGICNALQDFGSQDTREVVRSIKQSESMVSSAIERDLKQSKDVDFDSDNDLRPRDEIRNCDVEFDLYTYTTVSDLIIHWNNVDIVDRTKTIIMPRYADGPWSLNLRNISGYHTAKIIVPSFVNFKQARECNWDVSVYGIGWDEQNVLFKDWGIQGFGVYPYEKGLERIEAEGEGIAIGRSYNSPEKQIKYLTSAQKKVDINQGAWNFPNMRTLTLSNNNLEVDGNIFSRIGTSVQRPAPFPEWASIYALAGQGTKIVVGLGMTALMNLQGFPFGASTKHYFKCLDSNGGGADAGYVIYDGTQWITWRSLIPEDYFGPIPQWPDDVINADNKYFNLTYNSNMDHGVVGQIPDWNNVESADNTFRVDGNNGESPVCTSPGVWRQTRDTSSVYGAIPEWKNVTSAKGTYYNQGFLDTVWDITSPFSEIMPSTVAHDENTVKGTSFALRAYFTSEWGGLLEEIDDYLTNHVSECVTFVMCHNDSIGSINIQYVCSGTFSSWMTKTSYYGDGGFSVTDSGIPVQGRISGYSARFLIKGEVNPNGEINYVYWHSVYVGILLDALIGCFDFSKMGWTSDDKSSLRRINVCSVNHDVSGFEGFTELAIVEIIPGTTTSGQHILDNCFKNCGKLEIVILPNCTTVGAEAFSGCGNVSSVKLGLVSSFGENCFSGIGVDLIEN